MHCTVLQTAHVRRHSVPLPGRLGSPSVCAGTLYQIILSASRWHAGRHTFRHLHGEGGGGPREVWVLLRHLGRVRTHVHAAEALGLRLRLWRCRSRACARGAVATRVRPAAGSPAQEALWRGCCCLGGWHHEALLSGEDERMQSSTFWRLVTAAQEGLGLMRFRNGDACTLTSLSGVHRGPMLTRPGVATVCCWPPP